METVGLMPKSSHSPDPSPAPSALFIENPNRPFDKYEVFYATRGTMNGLLISQIYYCVLYTVFALLDNCKYNFFPAVLYVVGG
jgi:hypothetical protein